MTARRERSMVTSLPAVTTIEVREAFGRWAGHVLPGHAS